MSEEMTREQAMTELSLLLNEYQDTVTGDAIDMGITALEAEQCSDAISRQSLKRQIWRAVGNAGLNDAHDVADVLRCVIDFIDSEPSVTPKPKTGHWIRWYEQKENDRYIENIPHCKCSECGKEYDPHSSQFIKYCNECGAQMVDLQESGVSE